MRRAKPPTSASLFPSSSVFSSPHSPVTPPSVRAHPRDRIPGSSSTTGWTRLRLLRTRVTPRRGVKWISAKRRSHTSSRRQRFVPRHIALRIRDTNLDGIAVRGKQEVAADGSGGHRGGHLPHLGRRRSV